MAAQPASRHQCQRRKSRHRPIGVGLAEIGLNSHQGKNRRPHPDQPVCLLIALGATRRHQHKHQHQRPGDRKLAANKLPDTGKRGWMLAYIGIVTKMPDGGKLIGKIPDDIGAGSEAKCHNCQNKMPPAQQMLPAQIAMQHDQKHPGQRVNGSKFGQHGEAKSQPGKRHANAGRQPPAGDAAHRQKPRRP